jgi:hypothetical protein
MSRRKQVLAVLLVLFALALAYSYWRMPRQRSVSALKYQLSNGSKAEMPAQASRSVGKHVRLDLLDNATGSFSGFKRNIFRPLFLPPPEPRPKVAKSSRKRKMTAVVSPSPQPVVVPKDIAGFTFLGYLQKEGRKTVFLTNNSEIFLARLGDKVAGRYEVVRLTDDVMSLRSVVTGDETTIPIAETRLPISQFQ